MTNPHTRFVPGGSAFRAKWPGTNGEAPTSVGVYFFRAMKEPIRWSVIVLAVTGWRCCLEDQKPQPPKPPSPELGLFFWVASVLAGFRGLWPILKGSWPVLGRQSSGYQFHSFQSPVAHFGHAVCHLPPRCWRRCQPSFSAAIHNV